MATKTIQHETKTNQPETKTIQHETKTKKTWRQKQNNIVDPARMASCPNSTVITVHGMQLVSLSIHII